MKKFLLFLMFALFCIPWAANAQTTLLSENFDNMSSIATTYSATDWYAYNAGSGNNWTLGTSSSYANSGSNSASYSYSSSYAADCYLVSAPFTVSASMTELTVSLYERVRSGSYAEAFEVFLVKASDLSALEDVASATQYSAIASASYSNQTYAEQTGTVTDAALAGANVRLVVHCTSVADKWALYIDDITVEQISADDCVAPRNLAVTTDGTTATVTWDGTAANDFIVNIDGTDYTGQTSPYTFGVDLSTSYDVTVTADCGEGNTSDPVSTSFTTPACTDQCAVTIELTDAYGDGGGQITVLDATTNEELGVYTNSSSSSTYYLYACPGTELEFVFASTDSWAYENGYVITAPNGDVIAQHTGCSSSSSCTAPDDGTIATYTMVCPTCFIPTNLEVSDITTNSATLTWEGTSDSYMVKYSPWYATGDDVLPTGTMQTYTFDLSAYRGTGSIVIRHYDVTNMFRLNIDNIVVVDGSGDEVYSQDFEDCAGVMPSEFSNMDMDGDGNVWYVTTVGINDSYGLTSASWDSNLGELTPDNWLVLSGITLGGSISFQARGQDANFAAENFNVYVCPDNQVIEEPAATNSYDVTGLQPYTPVAWQVKGVCEGEETNYASSFFTTLDDVLIFTTEGNWNELSNWTDVYGNAITTLPTITDKVRIDEDVTIPSGVVATAKKAVLNGGTITIADGGQLKLDATVVVTMEKEIAGYGEGDANWYPITSPLTTTMLTYSDGWSYVNALADNYDLYTFDQAGDTDGNEWINYSANSSHANFTSGNNNPVFVSMNGYLYAHEDDHILEFQGSTAYKSYNDVETVDYTYDATSEDDWNGFTLIGNPYTCNAYVNYVDADGNLLPADLYVINGAGNGFVQATSNVLAPLAGAFMKVNATGKIQYSTEAIAASPALNSAEVPCLSIAHGEAEDQNAVECSPAPACHTILVDANNPVVVVDDFEGYDITTTERWTGFEPTCWTLVEQYTGTNDTLPQVYRGFNTTENGQYSLRMHFNYLYAMPELDTAVNLANVRLSLNVRQPYWRYKLQIGVMDINDPESFVPVAVVNNSGKNMTHFECGFESYTGTGRYIAFKNIGNSENDPYCTNYLDDVTLTYVEPTACTIDMPYDGETFESYTVGGEPTCWEVITEDVALESTTRPQVYAGFNTTAGGSKSLVMRNRCVYAMPELGENVNINDLTMTFNLRQPKSIYRLQVGVVDEQGNFTLVKTLKSGTTMEAKTVSFANCPVSGRIAFRNTLVPGTGMATDYLDYSYNYIDDINITMADEAKIDANDEDINVDLENIAVYPNPTTGNLYIDAVGIQKVECYSQMGQLVRVYDNVVNSIDLDNLSDGVYMLRITVPQGVTMRKVVKR